MLNFWIQPKFTFGIFSKFFFKNRLHILREANKCSKIKGHTLIEYMSYLVKLKQNYTWFNHQPLMQIIFIEAEQYPNIHTQNWFICSVFERLNYRNATWIHEYFARSNECLMFSSLRLNVEKKKLNVKYRNNSVCVKTWPIVLNSALLFELTFFSEIKYFRVE